MPKLSDVTIQSINVRLPDMHALLKDVREHVRQVLGENGRPTPNEMTDMSNALINKHPVLGDLDTCTPQAVS